MPYEFYKILHILMVLLFALSLGIAFYSPFNPKANKIIQGVASLFIFVAGMGLLARVGVGHGEPWPLWVKGKVFLWLVAAISAPILAKRLKSKPVLSLSLLFIVLSSAVILAIIKID